MALRDGSTVHVRPVRADDAPAVRAFFERLSPESTSLRFFSGSPDLDSAVRWATELDYQRRYGLVATTGGAAGSAARSSSVRPKRSGVVSSQRASPASSSTVSPFTW